MSEDDYHQVRKKLSDEIHECLYEIRGYNMRSTDKEIKQVFYKLFAVLKTLEEFI